MSISIPWRIHSVLVGLAFTLALLASACSELASSSDDASSTSTTASSGSSSTTQPDSDSTTSRPESDLPPLEGALSEEEAREILGQLGGQLAIGNGTTVAVVRPDGLGYVELDGSRSSPAAQPTWSRAGEQLLWTSVSSRGQQIKFQAFDEEGVADGDAVPSELPGPTAFYFQWRADDEQVLYIRNSPDRPLAEVGVIAPGVPGARMADGSPFFVSWNPEINQFAGHINEEQVAVFDPSDADDPEADPLEEEEVSAVERKGKAVLDGGGYSAPAWIDGQRLLVIDDGWLSIVDVDGGGREPLLAVDEPIRFVLSPDRSRVALTTSFARPIDQPIEASFPMQQQVDAPDLVVLDIESGDVTTVGQQPALAWEWSPDSSTLAWFEVAGGFARGEGRWRFWSDGGEVEGDTSSPPLRISVKEAVSYFPFFAQYAQSVTRWSPDSSAFAFAGNVGSRNGIWVHLVEQLAEPLLIAPGDFVTWGPGPTPPPTAGQSPA